MVISHFHIFSDLESDEEELIALLGVAGRRRGRRLQISIQISAESPLLPDIPPGANTSRVEKD